MRLNYNKNKEEKNAYQERVLQKMAEGVFQAIRWFRGLGREGRPNGIPWHSKRCGVQPHLEGIVWKENHSKHISKRCPGNKERLVYFMNQSLRRDITQVLLDEKEQRCGLSFVRWNLLLWDKCRLISSAFVSSS
ncbi:hypothetical protein T11_9041 [Trichinella zimbabwensis]|uniref:Uncharacterized protein n=1 Tax=Trichinella zimbabwensis TaxID=268475 RepID=A0A0V1HDI8_9BILA|nr:hypothetical protein T11_9041 [Trichinella zimbabwensis]